MKAKRDNIISELITLRITKAKAKENWRRGGGGSMKFTLNWLSCQKIIGINKFKKAKAKAKKYVGGINFTLVSVSTVLPLIRDAPDTFNFWRHVMRAIWSVRPNCSHRRVPPKETPLKPVQSLKHTTENSAEQTVMRTKWFKHIAI